MMFTKQLSDDPASARGETLTHHHRDAIPHPRHRFRLALPTSLRQTGFSRRSNPVMDREHD
jgi:hypothetical protein